MEPSPDASLLPRPQAPPASHPAAAAHLLGQILPRDSCLQDEDDAMMPVSAARSDTVNGCPPFGWAGFGGSSGSTTVQSSSLTSGLAIPQAQQIPAQLC